MCLPSNLEHSSQPDHVFLPQQTLYKYGKIATPNASIFRFILYKPKYTAILPIIQTLQVIRSQLTLHFEETWKMLYLDNVFQQQPIYKACTLYFKYFMLI